MQGIWAKELRSSLHYAPQAVCSGVGPGVSPEGVLLSISTNVPSELSSPGFDCLEERRDEMEGSTGSQVPGRMSPSSSQPPVCCCVQPGCFVQSCRILPKHWLGLGPAHMHCERTQRVVDGGSPGRGNSLAGEPAALSGWSRGRGGKRFDCDCLTSLKTPRVLRGPSTDLREYV